MIRNILTYFHLPRPTASDNLPPASGFFPARRDAISTKEIWRLTWPQLVMMTFQLLVNITGVKVAGFINGETQAALGLVIQCFWLLMLVGMTMASAAVSAMSQALGAQRPLRARRYLGMVFNLGIAFCVLTLALGYFGRHQLMDLLRVPAEIREMTTQFWTVFLLAVPGQYASAFSSAAFRAHKNVKLPLYTSIVVFVVNAFMSFGLALGHFGLPALGANGLALAIGISTSAGALFNLVMLHCIGLLKRDSFAPFRWQKKAVGYLIKVAIPAGGLQLSWQLGYTVLMAITASLPKESVQAVAGLTTGMRIESILFLPATAFNFTATILVGHCLGHGDIAEAKHIGLRVLMAGCAIMSVVALLLLPWVGIIAAFLAPDPDVQVHAISYIRINLFSTPFTVASMVLGGIFTGAGATVYPFTVFTIAVWLIRLPMAWFLGLHLWESSTGIFLAMLISQMVQSSVLLYILLRCNWARFAMRHQIHAHQTS